MSGQNERDNKLALIEKVGFDRHFQASCWEEYNRQFFDGLARKYDWTNAVHSFGSKRAIDNRAVRNIPMENPASILDVCTGSGDIALALARRFPDTWIVGVDVSENMLEVAREKTQNFPNISLKTGDALNLPFGDNSFDVTIISFGLRNLADLRKGLLELQRVTRPGGYVVNIDQGKPGHPLLRMIYELHFYHVAPYVGKILFHWNEFNSFRYLPESNRFFPSQQELVNIFSELGMPDVTNHNFLFGAVAQQIARVKK